MTKIKLYVQKAAQAEDEAWQQTMGGLLGPSGTNPTVASLEHPSSASKEEDSDDMDFLAPRKSRLSGPQLQAQLSRLTDQSRLRRLKTRSSQRVLGNKSQEPRTCVMLKSPTDGFSSKTLVREVS